MSPPAASAKPADEEGTPHEAEEVEDSPLVVIPRGGTREVGRSCYHVQTPDVDILVDCGLKQGPGGQFPDLRGINPGQIDAVILTHAHIDHSGGLPVIENRGLLADDAPVITTRPTTALCHTLLHDSIKIHEEEARRQGREQQFTRADVHDVLERFSPRRYGEHTIGRDLRRLDDLSDLEYQLGSAGHLLGSAWVAIENQGRRVVFSGDLGGRSAHLPEIETPPPADTLFLESTYGGTQQHRSLKGARNELYQKTLDAVKDGVPVLIPTFAVGRAQEVMQIFRERFPHEPDEVQNQLEVVYDGMARDATAAYHAFSIGEFVNEKINNWRMNSQDNEPFLPDCAWYPEDNAERVPILDGKRAPIIVAPSGMLSGGTSPAYLAALVEHYDDARVFFTGFQAPGTVGRELQDASGTHAQLHLPTTPFPNSELDVNSDGTTTISVPTAWVETIKGFSGHCARQILYEFAQDVDAKHVALVHGPSDAQRECCGYLSNNINADAVSRASTGTPIPVYGASAGAVTKIDDSDGAATAATVRPTTEISKSDVASEPSNEAQSSEDNNLQQLDLEDQIERLQTRVAELEAELTAVRHDDRITEEAVRQIVRETAPGGVQSSEIVSDSQPLSSLTEIDGVGPRIVNRLKEQGYGSVAELKDVPPVELTSVDQIGEATAQQIKQYAQDADT